MTPGLLGQESHSQWCPWSESQLSASVATSDCHCFLWAQGPERSYPYFQVILYLMPMAKMGEFLSSNKTQNIKSDLAAACCPANAGKMSGGCKGMTREDSEPLLSILTRLACGWLIIQAPWPAEPAVQRSPCSFSCQGPSPSTSHARDMCAVSLNPHNRCTR